MWSRLRARRSRVMRKEFRYISIYINVSTSSSLPKLGNICMGIWII